ncbi:MAG TPA: AAA family ATPase [Acidobacteriaceae bacterium]|jgi:chromosome partitioning protein|nr:AAA family ATPase [Acidobacteriaceae bacterium]
MILTVGNTKGGVGKTTLAINLTIALALDGADVLLIDGDEQGTAMAFTELRSARRPGGAGYTAVALHGAAIRTQVRQLQSKYDHILIDVGGRDSGSLRAALTVSNWVLIPTAPRSFDLWGVGQTADLVLEAREINANLNAAAVLNGADPRGRDNLEAQAELEQLQGIVAMPYRLVRRKAYPDAAAQGLGVVELPAHNQAGLEFNQLLDFLFEPQRNWKGNYDDCTQSEKEV